ncbi:hypothetical protein [Sedimentitalea sp.]|uniref:hypothetical protein n=1 Tax=Sedimentitalea sp. TaxID=2048915 RepID=UPI003298A9DC
MTGEQHEWLVFHRVRFSKPINGNNNPFPGPKLAKCWRFYPASPLNADGMRTNISEEWGGFGIYQSRHDAETVFESPEDHLLFLGDSVESYHAMIVPYSHRGEVNWRGTVTQDSSFITAPADPGGALVVFTSAGYNNPGPKDALRIAKFLRAVDKVQDYYGTLPDNIRRAVFSGAGVDGHDGITVSIWRSDAAMMKAAYKPGYHRDQMNYQNEAGHFDRSSFTRARIVSSKGSWDGGDPILEIS